MKINESNMPFRFYNKDGRDNYEYQAPGEQPGYYPVAKTYDNYITETLLRYIELGGATEELEQKGFISRGEDGKFTVNIEAIIKDCEVEDKKIISPGKEVEGFAEATYGISGFFQRYTTVDKDGGVSHKDIAKKVLEKIKDPGLTLGDNKQRDIDAAKIIFSVMATSNFLPRSTMITAAQMVADGAMMQIGCSQGKTTALMLASYIDMQKGLKVMNTSSNPGLVMGNFKDFCDAYQLLGVENQMCAITRDNDTDRDMIVTRERIKGANGREAFFTVRVIDNPDDKNVPIVQIDLPKKPKDLPENATPKDVKKYNKSLEKYNKAMNELAETFPGFAEAEDKQQFIRDIVLQQKIIEPMPFSERVAETLQNYPLVMADTMTLAKYENELDQLKLDGENKIRGICMCDEADCEFLDARPYEVTGRAYSEEAQAKRFNARKKADAEILQALQSGTELTVEELKKISSEKKIPLEFLKDAYYARTTMFHEGEDYVIGENGSIKTLNPGKRILEADTQGHVQAIYAMRANELEKSGKPAEFVPAEKEVKDVIYPYDVIGKYATHSLISGTMEDRKLGEFRDTSLYDEYCLARANLFEELGFRTPATTTVVDFRTVGPLTREERGAVFSLTEDQPIQTTGGDQTKQDRETCTLNPHEGFKCDDWRSFIFDGENLAKIENQWKNEVSAEIKRRTVVKVKDENGVETEMPGQPVLVSVPDKNTGTFLGAATVYTDANKPDQEMYKDGKMYFESGQAYFMDDAYGRGYNSGFGGDNGHVLITRLPANSRDLEQFLFRVARGGAEGSSSMVISPADPKLIEFLTEMDKQIEAGNIEQYRSAFEPEEWEAIQQSEKSISTAYFENVINGKISIDRLIFDMYPRETMRIMDESRQMGVFSKETNDFIQSEIDAIRTTEMPEEQIQIYEEAFKRSRVKMLHEYEGDYPTNAAEMAQATDKMQKTAAISAVLTFARNGIEVTKEQFRDMMPASMSDKELVNTFTKVCEKVKEIKTKESQTEHSTDERTESVNDLRTRVLQGIEDYVLGAETIRMAVQDMERVEEVKETEEATI